MGKELCRRYSTLLVSSLAHSFGKHGLAHTKMEETCLEPEKTSSA